MSPFWKRCCNLAEEGHAFETSPWRQTSPRDSSSTAPTLGNLSASECGLVKSMNNRVQTHILSGSFHARSLSYQLDCKSGWAVMSVTYFVPEASSLALGMYLVSILYSGGEDELILHFGVCLLLDLRNRQTKHSFYEKTHS